MEQEQGPNKAVIGIIVVVLLALVAGYFFYMSREDNATNQADEAVTTSEQESTVAEPNAEYTDGTYTATGTYQSPGGQEEIELTVTLENGVITSTEAETKAASGTSKQYQGEFINNYHDMIVGKSIDEVELDRVAGSSLTSGGFNDALDEIKQEASA